MKNYLTELGKLSQQADEAIKEGNIIEVQRVYEIMMQRLENTNLKKRVRVLAIE